MKQRFARPLSWFVFVVFCIVAAGTASDLQRGITFSPTEHITNVKLHNLVDETSISTTFTTDKSSAQPSASSVILFVDPSVPIYRKTTYNTFLLGATNLITAQSELDVPATNDFLLVFDTSAGQLVKVPVIAFYTNSLGIVSSADYTNWPYGGFQYLYWSNGVPYHIEHSNIFAGFHRFLQFSTNVASANPLTNPPIGSIQSNPTNADMIILWDALNQTTKYSHLDGLITNLPASRPGLTNLDAFMFLQTRTNAVNPSGTNPVLAKITIADLMTNLYTMGVAGGVTNTDTVMLWSTATNASPDATNFPARVRLSGLYQRFVTNGIPVASGVAAQGLHGLALTPSVVKWYLVCTNNGDASGYAVGDKLPVECAVNAAGGTMNFAGGANATQVFIKARTATPTIPDKTGTGVSAITAINWNLECDAEFWPHR